MSAPSTAAVKVTTATGRTSSPSSPQALGLALAVLSAIAFAGGGPFARPLLEAGWTAGGVVFMRAIAAGLVMLPFAAWAVRRDPGVVLRNWKIVLGYGLIAIAAAQYFYYGAIERLPVSIAMLVMYLAPVLLLLLSWVTTRRRPAMLALVGAAGCIGGLLLVLDLSGSSSIDGFGLALALFAAIGTAGYYLIGSSAPADFPPIALVGSGLLVGAAAYGLLALVGLLPLRVVFTSEVPLMGGTAPWWVPLGVIVLSGTVVAYALGLLAATRLGSRLASFAGLAEIPATFTVAALLLGEIPTLVQVGGTLLILAGVVCVRLAPDRQAILAVVESDGFDAVITGPIPTVTGAIPTITGAIPIVTGQIPIIAPTSQMSIVSSAFPAVYDEEAELDLLEQAYEWQEAHAEPEPAEPEPAESEPAVSEPAATADPPVASDTAHDVR